MNSEQRHFDKLLNRVSYFLVLAASESGRESWGSEGGKQYAGSWPDSGLCVRMVKSCEAATICAYEILLPWKSRAVLERSFRLTREQASEDNSEQQSVSTRMSRLSEVMP